MNELNEFQVHCEQALAAVLGTDLIRREIAGISERFIKGVLPETELNAFIYADGAEISGGTVDKRFELADYDCLKDLQAAFLAAVQELCPIAKSRKLIVEVAKRLLDNRIGVIEAARNIAPLSCVVDENDRDLICFVGIESQTDHLPLGSAREKWESSALAAKDRELQECENMFRTAALSAAQNLVKRYECNA